MTLPLPRGDPSHLLHQSSSNLRRPERPRQKARYAPSLAVILAESVVRYVPLASVLLTAWHAHAHLSRSPPPPLSPPFPPLLSPSRNVMNAQTQRVAAKHASVSASNALALARSAPSGSRYAQRVVHVVTVPGISSSRPFSKENNNVTMFREKIKDFLAAQGMIKGHSGSGARSSEQEGMLVLITDHGRSDTSSPQSPALSVDSSEDRRPNGHSISSIRHDHYPPITLPPQHSHSGYPSQRMSFSSARESSPLNLPRLSAYHHPLSDMADARETMNQELILPFSTSPTSSTILPPPPTSLVSPMSHQSCKNPYRY